MFGRRIGGGFGFLWLAGWLVWGGSASAGPLQVAILPPNDRPAVAERLRNIAAEWALSVEELTPEELVSPKVFTARRYPLAVYLGAERYLYTVHQPGDATDSLLRYLREGGFLLVGGFVWPFYRAYNWNGREYVRSEQGPLVNLAQVDEWLRVQMEKLGQTSTTTFNQALGLNIAGKGTIEFERPKEQVEFLTHPAQTLIPLPAKFPFPSAGEQRYRPVSGEYLLEGAVFTPIVSLVGKSGQQYGPGVALVVHEASPLAPGAVLYVWGPLLEGSQGETILRRTLALAGERTASPAERERMKELLAASQRLKDLAEGVQELFPQVPAEAPDLTYFRRQADYLERAWDQLGDLIRARSFACATRRLAELAEELDVLRWRLGVLVDTRAGWVAEPREERPPAAEVITPLRGEPRRTAGRAAPAEARPAQPVAPARRPLPAKTLAGAPPSVPPEEVPPTPKEKPFPALANPVVAIELDKGTIYLELYPREAPLTVANFLKLVKAGFYDGTRFHRREEGFVIQGGDPLSKGPNWRERPVGTGGPGYTIKGEFSDTLTHRRGAVGMARVPTDPDSAGSQFYICLAPVPELDRQYALFGQVIQGMEVVDRVEVGDVMKRVYVVQE